MKPAISPAILAFLFTLLSACSVDAQDDAGQSEHEATRISAAGPDQKLSQSVNCKAVKLQVLGAGGPEINDGMASSSFIIWINGKAGIMVDAGGGSSLNFEKSGADFNDLDAILLTHLHVDHSVAVPVYVKAGYFSGRDSNLPLLGPDAGGDFPSTVDFTRSLFSDQQKSVYPYLSDNFRQQPSTDFLIKPQNVNPEGKVWHRKLSEKLSVSAINVIHGAVPAIAWRVDYGQCSITFSGDMNGSSGNLQQLALNSNLLVANNAIPEDAGRIAKFLHMTPLTIGKIAKKAKVKKLLLAHFMLRTKDVIPETLKIIRKNYQGEIIIASDLLKVDP